MNAIFFARRTARQPAHDLIPQNPIAAARQLLAGLVCVFGLWFVVVVVLSIR